MNSGTELRKVPFGSIQKILEILDTNDDWKRVMKSVPQDPNSVNFCPKYNLDDMSTIEKHSKRSGRSCCEILFDEWGTSGRHRPTLRTLLNVFLQAEVYRAAQELADLIGEPAPQRPTKGPAAAIDTDINGLLDEESLELHLNEMNTINFSESVIPNPFNKNINNYGSQQEYNRDKSYDNFILSDSNNLTNNNAQAVNGTRSNVIFVDNKNSLVSDDNNSNNPNVRSYSTNAALSVNCSKNNKPIAGITPIDGIALEQNSVQRIVEDISISIMPDFNVLMNGDNDSNPQYSSSNTDSTKSNTDSTNNEQSLPSYPSVDDSSNMPNFSALMSKSHNEEESDSNISCLLSANLTNFDYVVLQSITNNFASKGDFLRKVTGKIGSGGFGEVFLGFSKDFGAVAVKRALSDDGQLIEAFKVEVKNLFNYQHPNIVSIFGYSTDGPARCIVCQYIEGGSLRDKLNDKVLNERQRLDILLGTANGIKHLHCGTRKTLIHRDIKSANILLTNEYLAKLCDFGIARRQQSSSSLTESPSGTPAYMAPEAMHGKISVKMDIFGFGIVILEVLTGLNANEPGLGNIKSHVEETCKDDITKMLDLTVGIWQTANDVYKLAKACVDYYDLQRPDIIEVCQNLKELHPDH